MPAPSRTPRLAALGGGLLALLAQGVGPSCPTGVFPLIHAAGSAAPSYLARLSANQGGSECSAFVAKLEVESRRRFYLVTARHCERGYVWARLFNRDRYLKDLRRLEPPLDGFAGGGDLGLIRLPDGWVAGHEAAALILPPGEVPLAATETVAQAFDGARFVSLPLSFTDGSFLTDCAGTCNLAARDWRAKTGFVYGLASSTDCPVDGMSGGVVLRGADLAGVLVERSCRAAAVNPLHRAQTVDGQELAEYLAKCDPERGNPAKSCGGSSFIIKRKVERKGASR